MIQVTKANYINAQFITVREVDGCCCAWGTLLCGKCWSLEVLVVFAAFKELAKLQNFGEIVTMRRRGLLRCALLTCLCISEAAGGILIDVRFFDEFWLEKVVFVCRRSGRVVLYRTLSGRRRCFWSIKMGLDTRPSVFEEQEAYLYGCSPIWLPTIKLPNSTEMISTAFDSTAILTELATMHG